MAQLACTLAAAVLLVFAVETHCQKPQRGLPGIRPCDDRYLLRDNDRQQPHKLSYSHDCCGGLFYNQRSHLCCRGQLRYKQPGHHCCGSFTYNPNTHLCCNGVVKTKMGSLNACCGSVPYDSSRQSCCYGTLVARPPGGQPSRCCGLKSYNPSTHVCCSRTISPKPAQCCGSASYNPNTHICCGGRVLSSLGISSPACCGSTVYDRNQKVCSCKTTCSRKRTARSVGCPCRNADAKCSTSCTCGAKKTCKNRAVEVQPVNRNPSAYARHQRAVEESQNEIKDFVRTLSEDQRETLLILVLSQGRGSLENARDLIASANGPQSEPPEPENDESWCICGVCRRMQDEQENVCCRKRTCVTSYVMFNTTCLDRGVLELAIRARCDIRADLPDYSTQSYRKAAYRQYTLWKYGKLGRGNRRILPSCVVTMIRQSYPAPDGRYMGFRQS